MNNHEGCFRGFTIHSEAWHARVTLEPGETDEIMIGMYAEEGGTTGEFAVRWSELGGESTPRLEAFNDSWDALMQFQDVLRWMASVDDKHISPQEFAEVLRSKGIKDLTKRVSPYAEVK